MMMLAQMESNRYFNLKDDIDPVSLHHFDQKTKFDDLRTEQAIPLSDTFCKLKPTSRNPAWPIPNNGFRSLPNVNPKLDLIEEKAGVPEA